MAQLVLRYKNFLIFQSVLRYKNFLILHTLATMYDHSGANEVCKFLYWTDHPQSIFESIVINLEGSNQQLLS